MNLTAGFYRLAYSLLKIYWFIFRPETKGVRNLIRYRQKFLFIRNTYDSRWNIPGGGIKPHETPAKAVNRETREEVGILADKPIFLGKFTSDKEYKHDTAYCYFSKVNSPQVTIQPAEILDYKWLGLNEIPANRNSGVDIIIRLYKTNHAHS